MFKKIDIKKFGLYKRFVWQANMKPFSRVNIIYGRNYSGKTTLSRIFDCVGQAAMHKDYADGEFTLKTDTDEEVTNNNLEYDGLVRVYNADYVSQNLSWLKNEDEGEIKSFTLLGAENKKAQEEINALEEKLGDVEKKTGLRYEYYTKNKDWNKSNDQQKKDQAKLDGQLKEKANREIKSNPYFVKPDTMYNTHTMKLDIDKIRHKKNHKIWKSLGKSEKEKLMRIIDEAEKATIAKLPTAEPHLNEYVTKVTELVGKKIQMTQVLSELVENDLLQAWVNQGRDVNKGRKTCAFCGSIIPEGRWEQLNSHFNKESDELSKYLHEYQIILEKALEALDGFLEARGLTEKNIYAVYAEEFVTIKKLWNDYVENYKKTVKVLLELIEKRQANLFKPIEAKKIAFDLGNYTEVVNKINGLIGKNYAYSRDMETRKQEAREILRLHAVDSFCQIIKYDEEDGRLRKENSDLALQATFLKDTKDKIESIENQIKLKELEKKDEGKAAQKVTELLVNHFGNESLTLEPELVDEVDMDTGYLTPRTKFVVKRGGDDAKNLSEGERSLISFCYFIAQMDDELSGKDAEKLVIFIDDPISSLDSSHVFFMYSLIESVIAEPKRYGQLFLSTHNLDFLKYLKRMSVPSSETGEGLISHYIVRKKCRGKNDYLSMIEEMPRYLRDYVTEYNFLFEQIYKMAMPLGHGGDKSKMIEHSYTDYYNIGNNMRKFLECYLFYRYPNTDDPMKNLKTLFKGHVPTEVNRIVNEYSHLAFGERGVRVMEVPEVETAAKLIMKAVQEKDPAHYEALCKSVDKDAKKKWS